MKKTAKSFLLVITLLLAINMIAQEKPVSFGIKAGMNLSNFWGDELTGHEKKARVGYQVGVTVDLNMMSGLFLRSGLELSTKGAKEKASVQFYDIAKELYTLNVEEKSNLMYLQLPIHIGYKVEVTPGTKISFFVGPYVAYGIGGKTKIGGDIKSQGITVGLDSYMDYLIELGLLDSNASTGKHDSFSDMAYKRFDAGIGGGVGGEFGNIVVNLGYDLGLANMSRESGYKVKNQNAYLTLGYKF